MQKYLFGIFIGNYTKLISKTCIRSISLYDIIMITNISFAYDNKHICCSAINVESKCSVFYILISFI